MACVKDEDATSEAFAMSNGVNQGYVLVPLSSFMSSAMLVNVYHDGYPGIRLTYRAAGHLLDGRRVQVSTRLSTATVHDLLFADDCALNTTTEGDMQQSTTLFASGSAHFGLTINMDKTVIMR
ncbi:hypothetical protein SprV_0802508900 [Sparganum proliferum]